MLNMDLDKKVTIQTHQQPLEDSSQAGIWRKPLAREYAERGHASSLVTFDPGASFKDHDQPLGEEILLMSGTFYDHSGDYHNG
ncbi:cupin domain-containing protein [Colwelliaceae bacterium BS250]